MKKKPLHTVRSGTLAGELEQRCDTPAGEDVLSPYYPDSGRKNKRLGGRTFEEFEAEQDRRRR